MQSWSHCVFSQDGHTDKYTWLLAHKKVWNMFLSPEKLLDLVKTDSFVSS